MGTLQDTRPIATTTTDNAKPDEIAYRLELLLIEHPDLELASVRLVPGANDAVMIVGRVGQLAEPECPSCHTVAGHPHTEYCQVAPGGAQPCVVDGEQCTRPGCRC